MEVAYHRQKQSLELKIPRLTTLVAAFLLLCTNGIKAQTTQTTLDQVELMKQLVGTWKFAIDKGTTVWGDMKSLGIGIEGHYRVATKETTDMEGKQLWGYDENLDKWISAQLMKGVAPQLYAHWFTSQNIWTTMSYRDMSTPTSEEWDMECKSPDVLTSSWIRHNKPVQVKTFTRVKE